MTKPCIPFLGITVLFLAGSCTTDNHRSTATPPAFQVFMLLREAGMQFESLELSDGNYRYSFWTDVVNLNREYPEQGTYGWKGQTLILNTGKQYELRSLHGTLTLWKPEALDDWERHQIINSYG